MKYFGLFIKKTLRYVLKPLSFLPALCIMCVIFSFSAQDGVSSSQISLKASRYIVEITCHALNKDWTERQKDAYIDEIHHVVRKAGHVTEYFALAVSISFPLYVYGLRGLALVLTAGAFCTGFACLDEYHQSFVAGRGPSGRDVLIDCSGIFPGIYLVRITGFIGRKTLFAPLSKKQREN